MAGTYGFLTPLNGTIDNDLATPVTIPWIRTVTAGQAWQAICIGVDLVTSAVVANRYVQIECRNSGGNIMWATAQPVAQAASLTRRYLFQQGPEASAAFYNPGGGATLQLSHPIPAHEIEPGGDFRVTILNTQAGDAFANYSAVVQKWTV